MADQDTLPVCPTFAHRQFSPWPRRGAKIAITLFLILFLLEALRVLVGDNFHIVLPGKVFRGAQPSASKVEELARRQGIRTIINLRGRCETTAWYQKEAEACQRLGISLEDLYFSAGRLPSVLELRRLIEVLDRSQLPLFIHCRRGSDRTGLAATIVLLLSTPATLEQALEQLSPRQGHLAIHGPAQIDAFFELYRNWLTENNLLHTPEYFRRWALHEYHGGACHAVREEVVALQKIAKVGKPLAFRVRYRNAGPLPWQFLPVAPGGVHGIFTLTRPDGTPESSGKAGLMEKRIDPGQGIDLTFVLPPPSAPGRFRLLLDLVDPDQGNFSQMNGDLYEQEIQVVP